MEPPLTVVDNIARLEKYCFPYGKIAYSYIVIVTFFYIKLNAYILINIQKLLFLHLKNIQDVLLENRVNKSPENPS